jgi:hypothetical protein
MKITLCFVFLLIISIPGHSQDNPDDLIKRFFDTFQSNTDKALDDIYATNVWTSEMKDAINSMKKTIKNYPGEMGKCYGFELITKQKCTERFFLYSYMARYDRQPMKVVFEFYKPNDKWILYSLNFSADIDDDVELAEKHYLQSPGKN